MKKRYISWGQLEGHCSEILRQMTKDNWKPELIIGVTRGGALPAVMLSQYLEVKMVGLDVSLRDTYGHELGSESNCWAAEDAAKGKRILIVDDINDQGSTLNWIKHDWESSVGNMKIRWGDNVRVAVIVENESSKVEPDMIPQYCGLSINKAVFDEWVNFPWEEFWVSRRII